MSELYLILYILTWLFTFVFYQKRVRSFDAGSFILVFYFLLSILSFLLWINPDYKGEYKEMKLFPFLYLYVFTMIATSPILKYNSKRIKRIIPPAKGMKYIVSILLITASIIRIPYIITHLQEGFMKIMLDSSLGSEVYLEALDEATEGGSGVSSLASIITAALSNIGILIFFFELTIKNKNKWLLIGLALSIIVALVGPISDGFRSGTVLSLFGLLITYFAFKHLYPDGINNFVKRVGLIMLVIVSFPILIMTVSRFGTRTGGAIGSIIEYSGQENLNFNNYGLDAGGIRYGDRTFNLIKRVFSDNVPKNYSERRQKYSQMKINDSVYYTFIGDFTLDFGPFWGAIIIIVFNMAINSIRIRDGSIEFHNLILVFLVMQICSKGAMYLFPFSDTANIALISFFLAYFAFKLSRNSLKRGGGRRDNFIQNNVV